MDSLPVPATRLAGPEPPTVAELPAVAEPPTLAELPAAAELAGYVVAAAVWAPSVHNTQPWWFSASGREISLYADAGRPLPVARVSWGRWAAATEFEQRLFGQVLLRRTHRGGFDPLPLAPELLTAPELSARRDGAILRVITDEGSRAALAAVTGTAEHALRADGMYARELASWAPAPGSARHDGVPHTAYPARGERTLPHFASRDFAHGRGWGTARPSLAAVPRSPGVVCLLT